MNLKTVPQALVGFAFIVEVVDVRVVERKGKKKDGGDYHLRLQECYLHTGHGYPDRFELNLGKDDSGNERKPYQPGFYALSPASVKVDNLRLDFGYEVSLVALPPVVENTPEAKAKA